MSLDEILMDAEEKMEASVSHLRDEYRTVRTGRASTGLVEHLRVEVESYGSAMQLRELANLAVAEGNVIVIKPFDPSTLKDIQRAIEKSELGINPQSDGKLIRLPVPSLSMERRQQLVNHIKQLAEAKKVAIRNVRRDANKLLEGEKKSKALTEDDAERGEEETQRLTDEYCKKVDTLLSEKSKELMEV